MCQLNNLELMKISSYYKKKMEIVNLSPSFSPNMYNKFIYRKDYYDGIFPSEIFKNNNIENSDLIISDLMKNMAHKYLAVKFPIQVDNDLDLFK